MVTKGIVHIPHTPPRIIECHCCRCGEMRPFDWMHTAGNYEGMPAEEYRCQKCDQINIFCWGAPGGA